MVTTLPSLKRSFSPHKHRPAFTSSIGNESTQSQTTDRIPSTGAPALFNLPGPDDYALGQEHPISHLPNRQTYNTDDASTLERFRIRELCEGWLLHRDACEWTDLRSIFDPSAFIAISWQQHLRDQAIDAWARGWERGDFTTHRVLGHAVEVRGRRAIDKMKVTISWRFADENGVEWDSDCDCRFIFFLQKQQPESQGWKILSNHLIYEKDKLVPLTRPGSPRSTTSL